LQHRGLREAHGNRVKMHNHPKYWKLAGSWPTLKRKSLTGEYLAGVGWLTACKGKDVAVLRDP
jgi:hypothetical protein